MAFFDKNRGKPAFFGGVTSFSRFPPTVYGCHYSMFLPIFKCNMKCFEIVALVFWKCLGFGLQHKKRRLSLNERHCEFAPSLIFEHTERSFCLPRVSEKSKNCKNPFGEMKKLLHLRRGCAIISLNIAPLRTHEASAAGVGCPTQPHQRIESAQNIRKTVCFGLLVPARCAGHASTPTLQLTARRIVCGHV